MNNKPVFVIGIGPTRNVITVRHPNLEIEHLDVAYDLDNPPELGQSLLYDKDGLAYAGPDCLHYTNFQNLTAPINTTPEWDTLLANTLQWRGTGTTSEALISKVHPNIVYLPSLGKACFRPASMAPEFTGEVFAFQVGNLDLQIEPITDFGWLETLHRTPSGKIKVGIVLQSEEGWNNDNPGLASRVHLKFSELELLHKWRTKFLNPSLLGKAIDPVTGELLPQYPDHPVPKPDFTIKATMNHPYAANYIVDAKTHSIQLLTDVVIREFTQETQDNG
jgi:hypothetical protein